jgi:DNA repair exonuclease SbcCD nuclease subunit
MKAVITGDWHLESGYHLGDVDLALGNTRLADAARVLGQIAEEECDVLIFLGDAARTATPKPSAYRVAQDALRAAKAKAVLLIVGNHDYTGEANTCVHVMAEGLSRCRVYTEPKLTVPAGLQVGLLPWSPPSRLFAAAPHDPRRMHQLAADALVGIARGLAAKVDPAKPSLLVGHWLLAGGRLQTGSDVMEAAEPLLPVAELEQGPWDVILFGHNHSHQAVGDRSWHVGPPMRGGFGEQDLATGYMVVEWSAFGDGEVASPDVRFVETADRRLLTVDVDVAAFLGRGEVEWGEDLDGAVVRLRVACTDAEAHQLHADGQRLLRELVGHAREAGAVKVIGPQVVVERQERERRSDLTVEVDPSRAFGAWLSQREIDANLKPVVEAEARRIMA